MKHPYLKTFALIAVTVGFANLASSQTVVFSEDFDPAPETLTDFNMQLGGNPELKPINTKIFALDQWGLTSNGSITDIGGSNGNVLQPQLDDKNNGRLSGIFIDPAKFAATGAGTYRMTFDVIAGSSPGAGRVYVGAGSGYDLSGATDAKLNLAIAANGFGVVRATGEITWPALTGLNGATAEHLITTSTEWILGDGTPTGQFRDAPGAPFDVETSATLFVDFDYDGTSAVVIAFGGYNTDVKIDNITIEAPGSGGDTWAGFEIIDGRYVDTGTFLGFLDITSGVWPYSFSLNKYIYLPEEFVSESGAWIYAIR
jgi:hypothetical protein